MHFVKAPSATLRENAIDEYSSEAFERNELDYGRKLYLIENCIYGVDIQSIATQIAKLRFFISLIVDQQIDDSQDNCGVRPLPNLETKFVAANTLIGVDKPLQMQIRNPQIDRKEKELEDVRRRHFTARTPRTKAKYRDLDAQIRTEISELLEGEGFPHETTEKIAHWDPYDQNASADFFDSEWMFGVRDGFDVVIGNPPYIQLQKDGGRLGRLYEPCNFDSFNRKGDIYCLFYEKANQLLKKGGYVCFITSNKWMRARYGKNLRDYFTEHTQPVQLLDMGPDVFDATVDTNILLLQNSPSDAHCTFTATTVESDFDKHTGDIAQYLSDNGVAMELPPRGEPWAILSPAELVLKYKIEEAGKPLKDWDINISYGIKTGYNEAFVIDEAKREELIAQDSRSAEVIKPLLRGRDIQRYHAQWVGLWLIVVKFKSYKTFPKKYRTVYKHLMQYEEKLKARGQCRYSRSSRNNPADYVGQHHWLELDNNPTDKYLEMFSKEKIVWQEMATKGNFLIDKNKFYSLDTTRILTGKNLTYLVGILNSKFFPFAFKNYYAGGHLGSKGIRFKSEFMKSFPVPPITAENQHLVTQIEDKVDGILNTKDAAPDANVSELEKQIDQIVYSLYNLTPEEIDIVEGAENV